ncbi:hypothetical protein [Deefgea piscis]|uniref:hypothetical protein n=1 Tax=Deefgea piscis TaxID=2739061 RepID=UPI001C808A3C|nr:hypothetical protein [Deefgea piscis]QZA82275.1 hypothetical protein K4H25_06430 [Deefgea piscis]
MRNNQSDWAQGVALRKQVNQIVSQDIDAAYLLAKSIRHPWYRCQALSAVAEKASDFSINKILSESFQSAMMCHDSNRRVCVACRPLLVAINRNREKLMNEFLHQCMKEINSPMDPLSKWCSVDVLIVIKKKQSLLDLFIKTFIKSTSKGYGWRVIRAIKILQADDDINKDFRYISHLEKRLNEIQAWSRNQGST